MSEIEFTREQLQELCEEFEKIIDIDLARQMVKVVYDVFIEIVQTIMECIRQIAIGLARFFLKLQLLEWKLPYLMADFIAKNMYWYWAMRLGFNWFERKFSMLE